MKSERPDVRYAIGFGALWAAEEALTGLLMPRYSLAQIVWMRFVFHVLLVLLIWGRSDVTTLFRTRHPWLHGARAMALLAMPASLLLSTVFYTSLYFTFADCFVDGDEHARKLPPTDAAPTPPESTP